MEAAERFCNTSYHNRDLVTSRFSKLHKQSLNPDLFTLTRYKDQSLRWATGFDLITGKKALVPAQVVFFNYHFAAGEPQLTQQISTGAAGGLDHESTLLRGIYEIVERDAFMGMYLLKIPAKRIALNSLKIKQAGTILSQAQRYNLSIELFELTNDLSIPAFLAIVIDRTGLGPVVSFGLKSSLQAQTAIVGAMEEAFHTRPWTREQMMDTSNADQKIDPAEITTINQRGAFWSSPQRLYDLAFLLDQPAIVKNYHNQPVSQELKTVIDIFYQRKIPVYYNKLTLPIFLKNGFFFYKVTIPQLQPLFLIEKKRELNLKRLKQIADFFEVTNWRVNTLPHPFL